MTTEKLVFNKLFKEELSIEKVELASAKDLDSILSKIFSEQKKADKAREVLDNSKKTLENSIATLDMHIRASENLLADFSKKANDLGIDADSVPSYKKLDVEVKNTKSEYLK